jgi:TolB-like protein/Flp pilus assembly protein TadD
LCYNRDCTAGLRIEAYETNNAKVFAIGLIFSEGSYVERMSKSNCYIYEFGVFRLDLVKRELKQAGKIVSLTPKIFDTLRVLVQNQGQIVTKDSLMDEIWADTFVEESSLMRNISLLRKALGEQSEIAPFIVTVPGQGYRFLAQVREIFDDAEAVLIVHEQTRAKIVIEETVNANGFHSLAVLPFKTIGNKEENDYLGLGMADALITKLSNLKQLRVRPTSAVIKYGGFAQNPVEAGKELRVESLIEGSVWQLNERLRVTVQLVNIETEATVWAEKFDESFTDIFDIQDSISERVAAALEFQLTSGERRQLTKRETENLSAYQLFTRGLFYMHQFTPQATVKAIPYLEKAIETDPNYALAHAFLVGCYLQFASFNVASPAALEEKSRALAKKGLELDEALPAAHYAQAFIYLFFDWNFKAAEKSFRRAVELNPNDAIANKHYGMYLFAVGRFAEAIAHAKITQELDPVTPSNTAHVGLVYYYAKRYTEAIAWHRRALEMDAHFLNSQIGLAWAFTKKEMLREAVSVIEKISPSLADEPNVIAARGYVYASAAETAKARKCLETLAEISKHRYVSACDVATIYAALGETEEAFAWLEKALEERAVWLIFLKNNPRFDSLRSDSRFDNLLQRIGFEID